MSLGSIGIWRNHRLGTGSVAEIEALGFTALWLGGNPSVGQARSYLEASSTLMIATGILNVWEHEPADVAAAHAEVTAAFPGRFLLGIGIGHREVVSEYNRPLGTMREYFDGLDSAPQPVPKDERLMAALGPKMLDMSAERSLGTHPYFSTPAHTRFARERLGEGPLVAPELAVVLEEDDDTARAIAREFATFYLGTFNYTSNLRRFGYTDADFADGGSDRLIDAVIPHGSADKLADAVREHLDAGADHVAIQVLGHGPNPDEDYRALAAALL